MAKLLSGTLDLLILCVLNAGPLHGFGMRLVLGDGLRDIAIGLDAGILLAAAASVVVRAAFLGFLPAEKQGLIFVAVPAVLGGVGAVAFFVPVWSKNWIRARIARSLV